MRFHLFAALLLLLPILRRCHTLGFERSVSDTVGSVSIQVESDSLPDDSLLQPISSYDQDSHFITASGDPEVSSSTGNRVDGCQSSAKNNSKGRKRGVLSCPAAYDIQKVKVEECTPAKKLCPIFLEPLCCTGIKRNNGFPFSFDVESCISCMYHVHISFHRSPKPLFSQLKPELSLTEYVLDNEWDNCRLDVCKQFETVFCCQQLGMALMVIWIAHSTLSQRLIYQAGLTLNYPYTGPGWGLRLHIQLPLRRRPPDEAFILFPSIPFSLQLTYPTSRESYRHPNNLKYWCSPLWPDQRLFVGAQGHFGGIQRCISMLRVTFCWVYSSKTPLLLTCNIVLLVKRAQPV